MGRMRRGLPCVGAEGAEILWDEDAELLMAAAGAPRREYRRIAQLDGVDGETMELTRLTPPDVE